MLVQSFTAKPELPALEVTNLGLQADARLQSEDSAEPSKRAERISQTQA